MDEKKPVIVTGGASGIGRGIAARFLEEGHSVLVADINKEKLAETLDGFSQWGSKVHGHVADVRSKEENQALGPACVSVFGEPADTLVLCAGVQTFQHASKVTEEEWDYVQSVNSKGAFFGLQAAGEFLPDGGSVVAISSIQARLGGPLYPHYSASKSALLSLVRSFSLALAPQKIRVNVVAPGVIATDLWDKADREISQLLNLPPGAAREERISKVPLQRAGTPEDVAHAVYFLASPGASYITGETIHVCGGDVML